MYNSKYLTKHFLFFRWTWRSFLFFFEVPIGAEASAEAHPLVYGGLCDWPQQLVTTCNPYWDRKGAFYHTFMRIFYQILCTSRVLFWPNSVFVGSCNSFLFGDPRSWFLCQSRQGNNYQLPNTTNLHVHGAVPSAVKRKWPQVEDPNHNGHSGNATELCVIYAPVCILLIHKDCWSYKPTFKSN